MEISELRERYSDAQIKEMVDLWQNDPSMHPLTCGADHEEHVNLVYWNGVLECPLDTCLYHQHWLPDVVIRHYQTRDEV